MARIKWDEIGERYYEHGVDRGVLYVRGVSGYDDGVPWNGLTAVNESPSGAEATPVWADNIKYLNLVSAEEFSGTIEALTYPDEFAKCEGSLELAPGVEVTGQPRSEFGFSYRTKIGNDESPDKGYKIHLVYGALAAPTERQRQTINETPEPASLSWEFTTTPAVIEAAGFRPTAHLIVNSLNVDSEKLSDLEDLIYGDSQDPATLPTPDEVLALVGTGSEG